MPAPGLSVIKGNPSADEVAAVVTVLAVRALAARASAAAATSAAAGLAGFARPGRRSQWSARSRLLRGPVGRGPGGWRASSLPR